MTDSELSNEKQSVFPYGIQSGGLMPTLRKKPVDPGVLRGRVEKAAATLKKSVLTAMRQDLIPKSSPLMNHLCALDEMLAAAFPVGTAEEESGAILPF